MPWRDSLVRSALCLLFVCSLAPGCGLPSKRMSLEDAVDDLDDVELAEATADDSATPTQPPSQNPDATEDTGGPQREKIALVNAEEPIDAHPADLIEEEPVAASASAPADADTHTTRTIEKVDTDTFGSVVLNADTPVLVDFYAEQCGPCKKLAPILHDVAGDTPGVKVVKVDIEESKQLAKTYRVRSVPTLILFKRGKPVSEHRGIADRSALETLLAR